MFPQKTKQNQKMLMFHFRCLNEPVNFLLWSDLRSWLSLSPSFPLDRKAENVSAVCSLPYFILFSTAPPSADSARFLLKQIYSVMCPSCVWEGDSQKRACLPARTHGFKRRTSATSASFFFTFHPLSVSSSLGASEPDTPDRMCHLFKNWTDDTFPSLQKPKGV